MLSQGEPQIKKTEKADKDKAKTEAELKGKEGKEGKEKKEQAAEKLKGGPDKAVQERMKKADQEVEDAIKKLIASEVMRFGPQNQKKVEAYIRKRIGNPTDPLAKHFKEMREKLMSAPAKEDVQKKQQVVEKREASDQEKALVDSLRSLIDALVLLLQNWASMGKEKRETEKKGKDQGEKEKKGKEGGIDVKTDQQIKEEISKELGAGRSIADLQKETSDRVAKTEKQRKGIEESLDKETKAEASLRESITKAPDDKTRADLKKQLEQKQATIGKLRGERAKLEAELKGLQAKGAILDGLSKFVKQADETMKKLRQATEKEAGAKLAAEVKRAFGGIEVSFRMHGGDLVPVIAPRPGQRGLPLAFLRVIQEDLARAWQNRDGYITLPEAQYFLNHPDYMQRALKKLSELNETSLKKQLGEAVSKLEDQIQKTGDPEGKTVAEARQALTKILENSHDTYITERLQKSYTQNNDKLQRVLNGIRISVNLKSRQVRTERMVQ